LWGGSLGYCLLANSSTAKRKSPAKQGFLSKFVLG